MGYHKIQIMKRKARDIQYPLCVATHQPVCNAVTEKYLEQILDIVSIVKFKRDIHVLPSSTELRLFRAAINQSVLMKIVRGERITPEEVDDCTLIQDLPGEEWRPVVGFENSYEISNLGRVKSFIDTVPRRELIMKLKENNCGYLHLKLQRKDGTPVYPMVHRLVAEAFIPNPRMLSTVNHIDGDKRNNFAINLEWNSNLDNNLSSYISGQRPGILTSKQVYEIAARGLAGEQMESIAKSFSIKPKVVRDILLGNTYTYYPRKYITTKELKRLRKEKAKNGI